MRKAVLHPLFSPAFRWVLGLTVATLLIGCGSDDPAQTPEPRDPFFTEEEWSQIRMLSPLPPLPDSPTNFFADDPDAADLGQKFFFDERFSGALSHPANERPGGNGSVGERGRVSCETCHQAAERFIDRRSMPDSVSLGLSWGPRNTPTVINAAYQDAILWDGRADSLWLQAIRPLDSQREQGVTRLGLAHVIHDFYQAEYEAVFGPLPNLSNRARFPLVGGPAVPEEDLSASASWRSMSDADQDAVNRVAANFGKALEAYQRLLVSGDSKFDQYVTGQHQLFRDSEKRGLRVFLNQGGCVECHSGPLFTDGKFRTIGVEQAIGNNVPPTDEGAAVALQRLLADPFNGTGPYSDDPAAGRRKLDTLQFANPGSGQFRTPSLRNVQLTAPYFHNGSRSGLTGVIEFYRTGGDPTGTFLGTKDELIRPLDALIPSDVFDLQEFLWTLTSAPLSADLITEPDLP